MRDAILIYEPDTPADAEVYRAALAVRFAHVPLFATSDRDTAIARAAESTILIAKAQHCRAELVRAMPRLAWIQALTPGIEPLQGLGLAPRVVVTSARGIHGPQMAELALLLMMSLSRRFPRMLANQREAKWERWGQRVLDGRTVVIVCVGAIGEALAARSPPVGQRIVGVSNRSSADGFDELQPRERLPEAAARADFLVLLVPYAADTHHLIDAAVIAAMRTDAYLLNLARGDVVDEAALVEALRARRIAGAALDVFSREPLPAQSPLWSLDNVIVTPHIGGMSDVYARQIVPILLDNVAAFLRGEIGAMRNRIESR